MRDSHYCDHLMLLAIATVLQRTIILYSGAEPNLEPVHITPDNVSGRFRPIHVGHQSDLVFVMLRLKGRIQDQDDIEAGPEEEDGDIILEEDVDDETEDSEELTDFQHKPTGEAAHWNVRFYQ